MKSKTCQRLLNEFQQKPWYIKLKIKFFVELYCIKALGFKKYFKQL